MGGDLRTAPSGKAPSFLMAALRDPYSGNLDRIQIIKGWMDGEGKTHERSMTWLGLEIASQAGTANYRRLATP